MHYIAAIINLIFGPIKKDFISNEFALIDG